jgi:hypothetical protein
VQAANWESEPSNCPPARWMSMRIRSIVARRLSFNGPTIAFCTKLGSLFCACRVEASWL